VAANVTLQILNHTFLGLSLQPTAANQMINWSFGNVGLPTGAQGLPVGFIPPANYMDPPANYSNFTITFEDGKNSQDDSGEAEFSIYTAAAPYPGVDPVQAPGAFPLQLNAQSDSHSRHSLLLEVTGPMPSVYYNYSAAVGGPPIIVATCARSSIRAALDPTDIVWANLSGLTGTPSSEPTQNPQNPQVLIGYANNGYIGLAFIDLWLLFGNFSGEPYGATETVPSITSMELTFRLSNLLWRFLTGGRDGLGTVAD
jgi:hypothetical protein